MPRPTHPYIATDDGWLYLAVLLDLFSRRVVGWATSATNDRALALAALDQAVSKRHPGAGLVHHTDRGSPLGLKGSSQHVFVSSSLRVLEVPPQVFSIRASFVAGC